MLTLTGRYSKASKFSDLLSYEKADRSESGLFHPQNKCQKKKELSQGVLE